MIIKINTITKLYLYSTIFYYAGFMNFFTRVAKGTTNNYDTFDVHAAGSMPRQIFGVILLFLGLFILTKVDRRVLLVTFKKNYWWVLLVCYFIISMQWSYEPSITFRRTIAFSTLLVAAFCIVQFSEMYSLLTLLGKAIFCAAFLGLIYALIDPSNGLSNTENRTDVLLGIYSDKNGGARIYAYGLLILVGLGRTRTIADWFMLGILVFCLILAGSATAIVMVIGGGSIMFLFEYFRTNSSKRNFVSMFVITTIIAFTSISLGYLFDYILQLLGRDATLTNRTIIWEMMDVYVENEPLFGYGFGAFWSSDAVTAFVEKWGFIANAHSGYYEILLNGGKVGFIILILVIISIISSLIKNYISHKHGKIFCLFISMIMIQIIVNYVAFIIINHNSFDMFLFALISFIGFRELAVKSIQKKPLRN